MIVYDLLCDTGHRFEGWFGSSGDYADQAQRGLVSCPQCGSAGVRKAAMAPAVPVKGNRVRRSGSQAQKSVLPDSDRLYPKSAPENNKRAHANAPIPPELAAAMKTLAEAQKKALQTSTWVGEKFADQSRAMYYGEKPETAIHGQASAKEARELIDEGIAVAPLPFPVTPPEETH